MITSALLAIQHVRGPIWAVDSVPKSTVPVERAVITAYTCELRDRTTCFGNRWNLISWRAAARVAPGCPSMVDPGKRSSVLNFPYELAGAKHFKANSDMYSTQFNLGMVSHVQTTTAVVVCACSELASSTWTNYSGLDSLLVVDGQLALHLTSVLGGPEESRCA